jgi:hypothetical protein
MTQVNIELITFFVARMTRNEQILWSKKQSDQVKYAVRAKLIEMRG